MARPIAIYKLSEKALKEANSIIDLDVYSGLKDFVVATIIHSKKIGNTLLSREELKTALSSYKAASGPGKELKPLSTANSMVIRRVKELEALNCLVISREVYEEDGKRKTANIHNITSLVALKQHLENKRSRSPAPQGRPQKSKLIVYSDTLEDYGITKLEADGEIQPYMEGAFSILDCAARSRVDKQTVIKCSYHLTETDSIEVVSSTSTTEGSGIMFSSDQRIIMALNGMLKQANNQQTDMFSKNIPAKIIDEYCFFDIYALTNEIGLKSNKIENRNNVRKMLARLKDTKFEVDASNSEIWRSNYMPANGLTKGEYRYITEFYSASDWYTQTGRNGEEFELSEDRYFVVKFHDFVFKSMIGERVAFINHESLKAERYDLPHRLNNWVKGVVGVRDKGRGNNHHQYTLDILQQRVRPAAAMQHFETQFYKLLERQDAREDESPHAESVRFEYTEGEVPEGTFWLNGYYFKVEMNEELSQEIYRKKRKLKRKARKLYPVVTIWRDRLDPIVGDESDHNKALARQFKRLVQQDEAAGVIENGGDDLFGLSQSELESV
ncbi:hypothetical protein [Dasania marina]|uniref:hypothetical protein n=1 Tax=Dasania marina TaxID=471499 RepID=UPI0030D7B9DB|tara:strand:+ start:15006 stop:16673 length:1668 start_codon:yes stop_codon:yes gene_type:complete